MAGHPTCRSRSRIMHGHVPGETIGCTAVVHWETCARASSRRFIYIVLDRFGMHLAKLAAARIGTDLRQSRPRPRPCSMPTHCVAAGGMSYTPLVNRPDVCLAGHGRGRAVVASRRCNLNNCACGRGQPGRLAVSVSNAARVPASAGSRCPVSNGACAFLERVAA